VKFCRTPIRADSLTENISTGKLNRCRANRRVEKKGGEFSNLRFGGTSVLATTIMKRKPYATWTPREEGNPEIGGTGGGKKKRVRRLATQSPKGC